MSKQYHLRSKKTCCHPERIHEDARSQIPAPAGKDLNFNAVTQSKLPPLQRPQRRLPRLPRSVRPTQHARPPRQSHSPYLASITLPQDTRGRRCRGGLPKPAAPTSPRRRAPSHTPNLRPILRSVRPAAHSTPFFSSLYAIPIRTSP